MTTTIGRPSADRDGRALLLDFGYVLTREQDRSRFGPLLVELGLGPGPFFAAWERYRHDYDEGAMPAQAYWAAVIAEARARAAERAAAPRAGAPEANAGGGVGRPGSSAPAPEAELETETLARLIETDLVSFMTPRAAMAALARRYAESGRPVGILSNMPPGVGALWERAWPWLGALSPRLWSGDIGLRKPDPAVFRLALERSGWEPGRVLFVDDVAANVEAAEAAGMAAHHFVDEGLAIRAVRAWMGD